MKSQRLQNECYLDIWVERRTRYGQDNKLLQPSGDDVSITISRFRATSILGGYTYELSIADEVVLIVGPNGTGKSTFLNIFYLFLTRQWNRLFEYEFSELTLSHADGEIIFNKAQLFDPDLLANLPSRVRQQVEKLSQSQLLDLFLSRKNPDVLERRRLSAALELSLAETTSLRNLIAHATNNVFASKLLELDQQLQELDLGVVLFMPTYRRIERDLKSIFPDIEDRYRSRISENQIVGRRGESFQEIISFGMDDITHLIATYTEELNRLSKNKSNEAVQEYIRDMVRGRIKNYSIGPIKSLPERVIDSFISRLDDQLLSARDKELLKQNLGSLRQKKSGKPKLDMRYLGLFVEKMLSVYVEMSEAEEPLIRFAEFVKKYLGDNKIVRYSNFAFSIHDKESQKEISLEDLSSGEKQIVSVFAYLLLSKSKDHILLIDEPELSLSVPWQKTFVPDLAATGSCQFILAVTHSPFVFDNSYRENIVDVRSLRMS